MLDTTNPIAGEMDDVEEVVAAQAIMDGIGDLIALQQQQLQLLAVLAQQLTRPKRIVRDSSGRALGVETVNEG
jgi:hypothetical protein